MPNASDLYDLLMFYENVERQAELTYKQNPQDVYNLVTWGDALVEISKYYSTKKGKEYLEDAVSKLEKALELKPKYHKALWCLGKVYTAHALLAPDDSMAKPFFDKATKYFQQAVDEAPSNYEYRKSLEHATRAPNLLVEPYKETTSQTVQVAASSASGGKSNKEKQDNKQDKKFHILGFIVLAVGAIASVKFSRRTM